MQNKLLKKWSQISTKWPNSSECDLRCRTCTGAGEYNCSKCNDGATLHQALSGRSSCLNKCINRHYLATDDTCRSRYFTSGIILLLKTSVEIGEGEIIINIIVWLIV